MSYQNAFAPSLWWVAQSEFRPQERIFEKWYFLVLTILSTVAALSVIPFIRDYSLHSVDDPDILLFNPARIGQSSIEDSLFTHG